jgi:hypothetical protein
MPGTVPAAVGGFAAGDATAFGLATELPVILATDFLAGVGRVPVGFSRAPGAGFALL